MITSTGYCKHVSGGFPTNCWNDSITSIDICESYCTNQKSCVGYDYQDDIFCELFTSDNTCPSDFEFKSQSETAKTMKDLVASYSASHPSYICYGKTSGKCNLHFCTLDIVFQLTCS